MINDVRDLYYGRNVMFRNSAITTQIAFLCMYTLFCGTWRHRHNGCLYTLKSPIMDEKSLHQRLPQTLVGW